MGLGKTFPADHRHITGNTTGTWLYARQRNHSAVGDTSFAILTRHLCATVVLIWVLRVA